MLKDESADCRHGHNITRQDHENARVRRKEDSEDKGRRTMHHLRSSCTAKGCGMMIVIADIDIHSNAWFIGNSISSRWSGNTDKLFPT